MSAYNVFDGNLTTVIMGVEEVNVTDKVVTFSNANNKLLALFPIHENFSVVIVNEGEL